MNRVGIWYGSWQPEDLYAAYGEDRPVVAANVARNLNETMAARGSSFSISGSGVNTSRRFDDLAVGQWIFVYFDRKLHLLRLPTRTFQP